MIFEQLHFYVYLFGLNWASSNWNICFRFGQFVSDLLIYKLRILPEMSGKWINLLITRDEDPVLAKKPDLGLCTSNEGKFLKDVLDSENQNKSMAILLPVALIKFSP